MQQTAGYILARPQASAFEKMIRTGFISPESGILANIWRSRYASYFMAKCLDFCYADH